MSVGQLVSLMQSGVKQIFMLASPVLGAALLVGLIVAILQAVTSIQEQTLTFVPKIFAILTVLALLGGWMFTSMKEYAIRLFMQIPSMVL
ncbi:MAG: flagellar biosynthesis protein FliQ [Treponema sp.]|jgi:flagellar biosynthetic protein FliQ|nr:flagellar biosynthesis protein FliQ [Treponema sp.]